MEQHTGDTNIVNKSNTKLKKLLIIFVIIFFLSLLSFSLYLLLQNKYIEYTGGRISIQDKSNCDDVDVEEDNLKADIILDTEDSVDWGLDDTSTDEKLINEGWSIYSVPDLGISIEIPNKIIKSNFDDVEIESQWKASYITNPASYMISNVLGTHQGILIVDFRPFDTKDIMCGGMGCLNMSSVSIDVYRNNQNKTVDIIWEEFVEDSHQGETLPSVTGQKTKKWNVDAYSYEQSGPGGDIDGYILLKNNNVYNISYYISSAPQVYEVGQRLLNSLQIK